MSAQGPSSSKYRPGASTSTGQQPDSSSAGGGSGSGGFTAEMRDRQARGKDPYVKEKDQEEDEDEDDDDDLMMDEDDDDDNDDDMDVDADDEDEESAPDERGNRRMRLGRGYVFFLPSSFGLAGDHEGALIADESKCRPKPEPFEDREQRSFALSVLDNPEQLMMYAQSAGDVSPLSFFLSSFTFTFVKLLTMMC